MTRRATLIAALLLSIGLLPPPAARAQDTTIEVGLVGGVSMTHWPVLIGLKNGYYAKQHIKLDLIHIASSGGVLQQLAAGSLRRSPSRPGWSTRSTPSIRVRTSESFASRCNCRPMRSMPRSSTPSSNSSRARPS